MSQSICRTLARLVGAFVLLTGFAATSQAEIAANWKIVAPYGDTTATIASKALTANVVTITTTAPHGFRIGEYVQVQCSPADSVVDTSKQTTYQITATPAATTFTFARSAGSFVAQASGGIVKRMVLATNGTNTAMCYNPATGHVLVSRGGGILTTPTNGVGIHAFNFDGTDIGELSMGPAISSKSLTANIATITTANPHGLTVGQQIIVSMDTPDTTFDTAVGGNVSVAATPSTTTFTYTKNAANVGAAAATGKVKIAAFGQTVFSKIRADQGGGIYGCVATLSQLSATDPFTVYYWASESADPVVIYRNNASDGTVPTFAVGPRMPATQGPGAGAYRLGESAFDVVADGSGASANVQIYLLKSIQALTGVDRFFRLDGTKVAGVPVISATSSVSLVGGSSANGQATAGSIAVDGYGGQVYVGFNAAGSEFARYESDGTGRSPVPAIKSATIASVSLTTNVATITTTGNHEFLVGQVVTIRGVDAVFNGSNAVVAVPSTTTFTFARTNANVATVASGGTVTGPNLNNQAPGSSYNAGVLNSNSTSGAIGRPVTFNGRQYYVAIEYASRGTPDSSVQWNSAMVADITGGPANAKYVDSTEAIDPCVAVTNAPPGDIAIDDQTARPGRFYVMCKNGQLGSYTIPTVAAPSTKTWSGGGDGVRWFDPANWSPAGVPNCSNDVVLNHSTVAGAYTAQIGGLVTAACRTLTIDAANAAKIACRISDEGYPCGTVFQSVGTGPNDLTMSGTFRWPLTKDESMKPRYAMIIFKGTNAVGNKLRSNNVATISTPLVSNLAVGDSIVVALNPADAAFDGTYTITTINGNSLSYASVGADIGTAVATVTTKTLTTNVATINTAAAHGFAVGQAVSVALSPADPVFDGNYQIVTVPTTTSFTYAKNNANVVATASGGSVRGSSAAGGTVRINGADQFKWNNKGTVGTYTVGGAGVFEQNGSGANGVAITGAAQTLSDGFSVTFGSTTGHLTGDTFVTNPKVCMEALYVCGDGTAANDLVVQNGGYLENYYTGQFSGAPAVINTWGGGNTCLIGANGNYVHGTSNSFNNCWTSDRVNEFFISYDGKLTWAPTANYITDLFGAAANFPATNKSYDFGNLVTANSWPTIMTDAAYNNTANPVNVSFNNFVVNANTRFVGQSTQAGGLTVTRKSLTANLATLSFASQNTQPGDTVVVALSPADPAFDGTRILTASTLTSVSFASNSADVATALSAGTITKQNGYQLRVNGNLTNNGTGLLSLDGQSATGRGVTFGGTSTVNASTSGTYAFPQGFWVKAGSSLTLGTTVTIPSAKAALVDGVVNTGANVLQAGTSAAAVGTINAASVGVINGTLKQWVGATTSTYTMPIGTATTSETATVAFQVAPSTGGSITARFVSGAPGQTGMPLVDTDSVNMFDVQNAGSWSLAAGDGLVPGTYNLSLVANGFSQIPVNDNLRVAKRAAGGPWTVDGTPGTNAFPLIARTGLSGFSEFGITEPNIARVEDAMMY